MKQCLALCLLVVGASAIVCPPNICQTVRCAGVQSCEGGVIDPQGGFCGCCPSCVKSLGEGDQCGPSFLLGVPTGASCGLGLECDLQTLTCKKPQSARQVLGACAQRQLELQRGQQNGLPLLGQQQLHCADDGSYAPVQCLGSVCYCVEADGTEIQGYQANIGQSQLMNCQCARDQAAYLKTGLIGRMFSCASNGNYQQYQCMGSVCYCADENGKITGAQAVPIGQVSSLKC